MNSRDVIEGIQSYVAADGQTMVVAADGAYLGVLSSDVNHPDSISNPQGNYGSRHSVTSTQNPHSLYGGVHGVYSPYNPHCVQPPQLMINSQSVGLLSVNPHLNGHDLNLILGILLGARYGGKSLQEVMLDSYSQSRATSAWLMSQTLQF